MPQQRLNDREIVTLRIQETRKCHPDSSMRRSVCRHQISPHKSSVTCSSKALSQGIYETIDGFLAVDVARVAMTHDVTHTVHIHKSRPINEPTRETSRDLCDVTHRSTVSKSCWRSAYQARLERERERKIQRGSSLLACQCRSKLVQAAVCKFGPQK